MNVRSKAVSKGHAQERDASEVEEATAQPGQDEPNVWLNCLWMAGPLLFTIASLSSTGLPLAIFLAVPGVVVALVNWIASPSPARKQVWRSVFIGCLASFYLIYGLASQWP